MLAFFTKSSLMQFPVVSLTFFHLLKINSFGRAVLEGNSSKELSILMYLKVPSLILLFSCYTSLPGPKSVILVSTLMIIFSTASHLWQQPGLAFKFESDRHGTVDWGRK